MHSENIFHITPKSDWQANEPGGIYQGESLKDVGFIHCCFHSQIDKVMKQWFAGIDNLLLVEIDPQKVNAEIRYENLDGGSENFPHIYGPINLDAVITISEVNNPNERKNE